MNEERSAALRHAREVTRRHVAEIWKNPEVVGVGGPGRHEQGGYCLQVYVRTPESKVVGNLPDTIEDLPVRYIVTVGTMAGNNSKEMFMSEDRSVVKAHALDVLKRHKEALMSNPEVTGISNNLGRNAQGAYCIMLYVLRKESKQLGNLPDNIEQVPLELVITGQIRAF